MSGNHRSAVIIARLLGIEGYSNYVHNQVEKYWKHKMMRPEKAKHIERVEREFSEIMADMDERDRLLVGKFIGLRSKMNFDAGLRIGLMAYAHHFDHEIFPAKEPDR